MSIEQAQLGGTYHGPAKEATAQRPVTLLLDYQHLGCQISTWHTLTALNNGHVSATKNNPSGTSLVPEFRTFVVRPNAPALYDLRV